MEMTIEKSKDILEDLVAYMASLGSAFPNELYANHSYAEIWTAIRTLEKLAVKERLEND